jgi:AcrR family transcriptional regulator
MRGPERRAQLLNVARRVFGRNGFHSASMDTVAKEAGVTKPILYDHFPSKKELYVALLDGDLENLQQQVREALDSPIGNRERIRAGFQAYFDFVDDHAEGFQLLMQETVGTDRDFTDRVRRVRDGFLDAITDLIVRESKGLLDRDKAETVALGLIGMVETVAQRSPGGPKKRRQAAVEMLVQLAWTGITNLSP